MTSLHQGDCTQLMRDMPSNSVDFILTDPPYLMNYVTRGGKTVLNDNNDQWLYPAFAEAYRLLRRDSFCLSFYGWHAADRFMGAWKSAGFRIVGHFVFPKQYSRAAKYVEYRHEQAYLLAKGRPPLPDQPMPDVRPWIYSGNHHHPTEKAVDLLKPFIAGFSKPGDVVFDPFCGSGSTLVAARELGRKAVGIELDPNHHRMAVSRLAVFGESGVRHVA